MPTPEGGRQTFVDGALALGNVVLADHGRRAVPVSFGPVPDAGRFEFRFPDGPLTQVARQVLEVPLADGSGSEQQVVTFDPAGFRHRGHLGATRRGAARRAPHRQRRTGVARAAGPRLERHQPRRRRRGRRLRERRPAVRTRVGRVPGQRAATPARAPGRGDVPHGNGAVGNVAAEAIRTLLDDGTVSAALREVLDEQPGACRVWNPLPATGGTEPETIEQVRQRAPVAFRTQLRCVTAADYAERAAQFGAPGPRRIQRAVASIRWTGSWFVVVVAVDPVGSETVGEDFLAEVTDYLDGFRMAGHDLQVVPAQYAALDVGLAVQLDDELPPGPGPRGPAGAHVQPAAPRRAARPVPPRPAHLRHHRLPRPDPRRGPGPPRGDPGQGDPVLAPPAAGHRCSRHGPDRDRAERDRPAQQRPQPPRAGQVLPRLPGRWAMSCGCGGGNQCLCDERTPQTPLPVHNAPGQPVLHRRVATQATAKATMLRALSDPDLPGTTRFTARNDEDFGVAFIDAAAVVADIVSFYTDRFVNEHYLRTASERRSLVELSRLIGYQPRPGLAPTADLVFTLDTSPGAPAATVIPAGTGVQSSPDPGQSPVIYETLADISASPAWNAVRPRRTSPHPVAPGTTLSFAGAVTLAVGDGVLFRTDSAGTLGFGLISSVTDVAAVPELPGQPGLPARTDVSVSTVTTNVATPPTGPPCSRPSQRCPGTRSRSPHGPLTQATGAATRSIKVLDTPTLPRWPDFPGVAQIAQLRRTVTKKGKKHVEIVYIITSAKHADAPPAVLAAWVQGHWCIEDRLHYVRDFSYDEDRSQVRTANAPHVMATLRNTTISILRLAGWDNIAAALRHHARNPERAITCALTC